MTFLFGYNKKNGIYKTFAHGGLIKLFTLAMSICIFVGEKLADEKGMPLDDAIRFVSENVVECYELEKCNNNNFERE